MASSSNSLSPEDYLWPLTGIRDTLTQPTPESTPSPKLRSLLKYHLPRLQKPWSPYKPLTPESKTKITGSSINLPSTNVSIPIDDTTRQLALKLADRIGIDAVECILLCKSYDTYASAGLGEGEKLERVIVWYADEVEAILGIVLAILQLSRLQGENVWADLASEFRDTIVGESGRYVEGIFRAWGGLAQSSLTGYKRSENPLFWTTHQLSIQDSLLQILFLILYQFPDRPASISVGLIRGSIMSGFGTSQANREIWGEDFECQVIQTRIRDSVVTICIEAMCLASVIAPPEDGVNGTILSSIRDISDTHTFLLQQSEDLVATSTEPQIWEMPIWPMSIICLAWSIMLGSLSPDLAPPSTEGDPAKEMLRRAIRRPSAVFQWLEEILSGPLFAAREEDVGDGISHPATYRRKVIKDVLMGLVDTIPIDTIPDRKGLYRVWELLFGGGAPATSNALCADYWLGDFPVPTRQALLEESRFPHQPAQLPGLLAALSGSSEASSAAFDVSPAAKAFEYLSNLPNITHQVDPRYCRFIGKDTSGRMMVESARELILPGGERIQPGRQGVILNRDDSGSQVVTWETQMSGWGLLLEILRTAAGLRPMDQRDGQSSEQTIYLSVGDLGIQATSSETLAAGLSLIASVLSSSVALASELLLFSLPRYQSPTITILELAIATLQFSTSQDAGSKDTIASVSALETLGALVKSESIWLALRASSFFGIASRKKGIASALIHSDAPRDQKIIIALLRFVSSLCVASQNGESDEIVMRAAVHTVFEDIWMVYQGWRINDPDRRFDIGKLITQVLDDVLRHPLDRDPTGKDMNSAAQAAVDLFIKTASMMTYRPLLENITDTPHLSSKSTGTARRRMTTQSHQTREQSIAFLATLLRVAHSLQTPASALPNSLLASQIARADKAQLVDYLFSLSFDASNPDEMVITNLKTLRTYLEVISMESSTKPSLASLLRDAPKTCQALSELGGVDNLDLRASVWHLLSAIVATQPGCAPFCIGSNDKEIVGTLKIAVDQIFQWKNIVQDGPHALAALLAYLNSVLSCPSATNATALLSKDEKFWQAIQDISTRPVPTPPTFTLSMHSEDFASRIQAYAYATQARANATGLLASELARSLEQDEEGESKVLKLLLGSWRNGTRLQELSLVAVQSSASPELHEVEGTRLQHAGVHLMGLKTVKLACEREYGRTYLYDGSPSVLDTFEQASVNLAIDMLNLNWSMLDADIALTKSFRSLGEVLANWTEGDNLAASVARKAALAVAEALASEDRGGDVMLAIQLERLYVLQVLLDTAFDGSAEVLPQELHSLAVFIRHIVESTSFPPVAGLRHPDLPPIHRPILRILYMIFRAFSSLQAGDLAIDTLLESGTVFILEAADISLDYLMRGSGSAADLGLIVGAMSEVTRSPSTAWFDRVAESNLISRSLDLLRRTRLSNGFVPSYIPSILLLHLSLASHPFSAEKLAVSGLLPAYSDNVIATEAEYGRIEPLSGPNTLHSTWCGFLLVVKALLANLPNTASIVRSDVIPFMRISTAQILRALGWDGEASISQAAMDETELVLDVLYGIASALAIADTTTLLNDFAPPAIGLLKSIRHALSHPRLFSTLIVPSDEEEQSALEKELAQIDDENNVNLVDYQKTPVLAGRVYALLRIARTAIVALVSLTKAWGILLDQVDDISELLLESDDQVDGPNSDPVGVINDLNLLVVSLSEKLSINTPESAAALRLGSQISEATAVLSTSQLIIRKSLLPEEDYDDDSKGMMMDMDHKSKPTRNRGHIGGERAAAIVRELEADLMGILTNEGGVGDKALMSWLVGVLDSVFEEGRE